jgi:hypothetical protein
MMPHTHALPVSLVSPDEARFSASIRGLYPSRLTHLALQRTGKGPGYSTRKARAEFRENKKGEEGAAQARKSCLGWSS